MDIKKKIKKLPLLTQIQIKMEINNDPAMINCIKHFLAKPNYVKAIINDQYSAVMERIKPGSFPESRGFWQLSASVAMEKYKEIGGKPSGMSGLGDLGDAFGSIIGEVGKIGGSLVEGMYAEKAAKQARKAAEAQARADEAKAAAATATAGAQMKLAEAELLRAQAEADRAKLEASKSVEYATSVANKAIAEQQNAAADAGWGSKKTLAVSGAVAGGAVVLGIIIWLIARK